MIQKVKVVPLELLGLQDATKTRGFDVLLQTPGPGFIVIILSISYFS